MGKNEKKNKKTKQIKTEPTNFKMKFSSLVLSLLVMQAKLSVVGAQCEKDYTIKIAIAYDKSFCDDRHGGDEEAATNEVKSIVTKASEYFAANDRCSTVSLDPVYIFGDCNPDFYDFNKAFPSQFVY